MCISKCNECLVLSKSESFPVFGVPLGTELLIERPRLSFKTELNC